MIDELMRHKITFELWELIIAITIFAFIHVANNR